MLEAAQHVFQRYGYARTTMGDIAASAGVSRPALYLLFPHKDALFSAVIQRIDERTRGEINKAISGLDDLKDKLLHACTTWGSHGVELAAAHPDSADLFDLRFDAVRQAYANFERLVADLIRAPLSNSGLVASPEEVARVLVYGMRGLRATAADVADMRRLIEVQVITLVHALQLEAGGVPSH